MRSFDEIDNVDELIDFLVYRTPQQTTDDAVHDFVLVEHFFPHLQEFDQRCEISSDEVENFKQQFDYSQLGIDKQTALLHISSMKSIDRIVDTLVQLTPNDVRQQIMKDHIQKIWFEQNTNGDFQKFKSNINLNYWKI